MPDHDGLGALADHKADRLAWVLERLGVDPNSDEHDQDSAAVPLRVPSGNEVWELARPTDPDVPPREQRLLRAVDEALQRAQLDSARQHQYSATGEKAA